MAARKEASGIQPKYYRILRTPSRETGKYKVFTNRSVTKGIGRAGGGDHSQKAHPSVSAVSSQNGPLACGSCQPELLPRRLLFTAAT